MKRYLLYTIIGLLCCLWSGVWAQDNVKVTASAPSQVTEKQRFQLIFTVHNAQADSFRLPKMKTVRLISGPTKNSSSTMQLEGGRVVSSTSVSLVYTAIADKKGKVTIPSASIWSKGKKYTTNEVQIEVLSMSDQQKKEAEAKKQAEQQKNKIPQAQADEVAGDDMFIRTEWEDGDVYADAHNNLVVKLYYRVNVAGWDNIEWPKFKNCEVTDAGVARNGRYGRAQVNGVTYNTVIIGKKDVVPSKVGKLTIDSGSIDVILNIPNKNDFWGGYHKASKRLVIPGISTTVKPYSEKSTPVEPRAIEQPHWNL